MFILHSYYLIIIQSYNMDTIDLILNALRYAPLCLMGLGTMMLLWIQVKELKKS